MFGCQLKICPLQGSLILAVPDSMCKVVKGRAASSQSAPKADLQVCPSHGNPVELLPTYQFSKPFLRVLISNESGLLALSECSHGNLHGAAKVAPENGLMFHVIAQRLQEARCFSPFSAEIKSFT
jgi:hypothetical protein